ncbi:hypothetical protein [uncultured Desulfobacter sp.]|uniref:hypothetical protein n=1 Tax=uncultured Desulfobacter sp. TaxID=240139 RepID=UPI002AABB01A|nr:hypothetical protein [uncultured Desulfobacter sp.]
MKISFLSIGFNRIKEVEDAIEQVGVKVLEIPREASFLPGKIFLDYQRNQVEWHKTQLHG